jgi:hypothetical protein
VEEAAEIAVIIARQKEKDRETIMSINDPARGALYCQTIMGAFLYYDEPITAKKKKSKKREHLTRELR